jgi:hypothetical protein
MKDKLSEMLLNYFAAHGFIIDEEETVRAVWKEDCDKLAEAVIQEIANGE